MILLANQNNYSCHDLAYKLKKILCLYSIPLVSHVSIPILLHLDAAASEYMVALQR